MKKRTQAGLLAIIAGILALITNFSGGLVGFGFYVIIFQIAAIILFAVFNGPPPSSIVLLFVGVFLILYFLAAAGGLTVIVGGLLIWLFEHLFLGRWLIGLGIGVGLISLIWFLIMAAIGGVLLIAVILILFTLRGIAIILSIIARLLTRKIK
ncbi:MAG: hypothetical protein ACFFCD_08355 [Promethearchaeota archaeon]